MALKSILLSGFALLSVIGWSHIHASESPNLSQEIKSLQEHSPQALVSDEGCEGDCVAIGEWQFSVAIGLGGRTNPVIGQDAIPYIILPEVKYYGERFFLENFDLGYTLFDLPKHQLHLMLFTPGYDQAFFNRWDVSNFTVDNLANASPRQESPPPVVEGDEAPVVMPPLDVNVGDPPADELNGGDVDGEFGSGDVNLRLRKRRASGLAGLEYLYLNPYFEFQFQALKDVTGVHYGGKYRLALTVPLPIDTGSFTATVGATSQSARLLDYYYGIDASEVGGDASFSHDVRRGISRYFRLDLKRPINDNWTFRGIASYKDLGSEIVRSPLVVDRGVFTLFFGGVYHF